MRLQAFREMYKVRDFELVLCVDVWHRLGEDAIRELNQAVAAEKAERGFGNLSSEPLVTYSPRRSLRVPCEVPSHFVSRSGCVCATAPL